MDDNEMMIKHRTKIIWAQRADAKSLARLFEDFDQAQLRLKQIYAVLQDPSAGHKMAPRTHESLMLAMKGLNYTEMAQQMGIQRTTVPGMLKRGLRQIGIKTKPDLAFAMLRRIREILEGVYIGPAIGIEFPIFIQGYGEIPDLNAWKRFLDEMAREKAHTSALKEALVVDVPEVPQE